MNTDIVNETPCEYGDVWNSLVFDGVAAGLEEASSRQKLMGDSLTELTQIVSGMRGDDVYAFGDVRGKGFGSVTGRCGGIIESDRAYVRVGKDVIALSGMRSLAVREAA